MPRSMGFSWTGDLLVPRVRRAVGRSTMGIAESVAVDAKRLAHIGSGHMRDSIHVAMVDSDGQEAGSFEEITGALSAEVEVGSWVEYAATEEIKRGHRFIQPAVQMNLADARVKIIRAFAEEGMLVV